MPVDEILITGDETQGVKLASGQTVAAKTVLANPTAKVTFEQLIDSTKLPSDFLNSIQAIGMTSFQTF